MGQIPIEVKRTEAVSVEAVSVICSELLEWLEKNGFTIHPSGSTLPDLQVSTYERLGITFAREWQESLL